MGRSLRVVSLVAALALLAGACGGKGGSGGSNRSSSPGRPRGADNLAVEPASYDLAVGPPGRFIVGALTADHRFVGYGTVQLRFAYLGTSQQRVATPSFGPPSTGSFLVIPGTDTPNPTPTRPTILDAASGRGLYATTVAFDHAGFWEVEVSARLGGRLQRATGAFDVVEHHAVPAVGDQALPTQNLTLASADAPKAAIDSRANVGGIPDPELHQTTIAAALAAHRPIVAVFATPVYCVSRFCGPVTDMAQQLAHDYADRASFVHVEIWRDFEGKAINKAAADWLYRNGDINEPWVFVIGADGKIVARFDNVATRGEIEPLLKALPVIGPG